MRNEFELKGDQLVRMGQAVSFQTIMNVIAEELDKSKGKLGLYQCRLS